MSDFSNYPTVNIFKSRLAESILTAVLSEQMDLLAFRYGEEYCQLAERVLTILDKMKYDTYITCHRYIYDYLKQMKSFLDSGNYKHSSYDDIKTNIYQNADIMLNVYMPGLFLAYATSSILYTKYHLFRNKFLPLLNNSSVGVDIGFGEGFYLWELGNVLHGIKITGFDISEHALTFASKLLGTAGISIQEITLSNGDILNGLPVLKENYDFCIISEVIEHVKEPGACISEASRILKTGGYLFLSTDIDSNHMDHVTNFISPDVVEELIESNNFLILDKSLYRIQDDFPKTKDISIGLSYVCKKKVELYENR